MSAIPENYWTIVSPRIGKAKELLERGEKLAAIAFVGSFSPDMRVPVLLQSSSIDAKDQSAWAIKSAAESLNADFVFIVMGAWSLRKDKLSQVDAIMETDAPLSAFVSLMHD